MWRTWAQAPPILCSARKPAEDWNQRNPTFQVLQKARFLSLACSEEWKQQREKKWCNIHIYVLNHSISGHLGPLQSTLASFITHLPAVLCNYLWWASKVGWGARAEPWGRWSTGQKVSEPGIWSDRLRKWLHRGFFDFSIPWFQTSLAYSN